MINLKVYELNPERLKKVTEGLRYFTSKDFFRTIPLSNFEDRVLEYMHSVSPEGRSQYKDYLAYLGYAFRGALMSFKEGWRVRRETSDNSISFKVWNLLETIGGKSGQNKFQAVEYGTKSSTWIAARTFRFKSKEDWVTIMEGRSVTHAETEGANVQEKTGDYIERVLLPEIESRVSDIMLRRLR